MTAPSSRTAFWSRCSAALLGLALAGCTSDAGSGNGVDKSPTVATATLTLTPTVNADQQADDLGPVDAGGGLEFDPVAGRLIIPEAGPPPPRSLRPDMKLTTDVLPREDQVGLVLDVRLGARAVSGPPKGAEVDFAGVEAAAKQTIPKLTITLTAVGRMKIVFDSRALPLPYKGELRARHDRYGNLAFWPGTTRYRIVPPGALRTVLDERRVDVTPLSNGTKIASTTGTRLEQNVRVVELESPLGKIQLELATMPEAGLGGPLFCRALVELVAIDPATAECAPEEVPLRASITWTDGGGGVDFVVSGFERRTDLSPNSVLVPPPASEKVDDALPEDKDGVHLTQEELRAFRTQAVEVRPADPAAPPDGFIADNGRDQLMTLYLDGVPVVTVPPFDKRFIIGPKPGRYVAQWRTFLGDRIDEEALVELPGILRSVPIPTAADAGP